LSEDVLGDIGNSNIHIGYVEVGYPECCKAAAKKNPGKITDHPGESVFAFGSHYYRYDNSADCDDHKQWGCEKVTQNETYQTSSGDIKKGHFRLLFLISQKQYTKNADLSICDPKGSNLEPCLRFFA